MRSAMSLIDNYDGGRIARHDLALDLSVVFDTYLAAEYDVGFEDGIAWARDEDDDDGSTHHFTLED